MAAQKGCSGFVRLSTALVLLTTASACKRTEHRVVTPGDSVAREVPRAEPPSLDELRKALGSGAEKEAAGLFPYYMHVLDGFVVLRRHAPESWSAGQPATQHSRAEDEKAKTEAVSTAYRSVRISELPEVWRKLPGTRLSLMNEKGVVCQGTVGELLLLEQAVMNHCEGGGQDPCTEAANRSGSGYASLISDAAKRAGMALGARIVPAPGAGPCSGVTWSRVAMGPPPKVTPGQNADPAWRQAALTELGKLLKQPNYRDGLKTAPRNLAKANPAKPGGPWDKEAGIQLFPSALGGASLLSLIVNIGNEELTPEYYQQCILWAVSGSPESAQFRLLDSADCKLPSLPLPALRGAVDVDGDGRVELLTNYGLNRDPLEIPLEYSDGATGDGMIAPY